ncbi:hypothetical protein [Pseudomonas putida]|uniref:hypothetical protein n=1 Tax=Pseudomonas putida TaxID=303 RepID=UPI0018D8028B|nr:hypothetical protein [Pseudomonas putida]MBH3415863.1 hypothetical protein [Pseudomonas putida]MDG9814551.1 hypothetical protein [Pseudomonas putida]
MNPADFMIALNEGDDLKEYLWYFESPLSLFFEPNTSIVEANNWLQLNRQIISIQANTKNNLRLIDRSFLTQNFHSESELFSIHDHSTDAAIRLTSKSPDKLTLMLECWTLYEKLRSISYCTNQQLTPLPYSPNTDEDCEAPPTNISPVVLPPGTYISNDESRDSTELDYLTANLIFVQEKFFDLLSTNQSSPATVNHKLDDSTADVSELDIVFSQLMQAQASIESYQNLCTDMVSLLKKAETHMTRARKLIECLDKAVKPTLAHASAHSA